jgi:ATP-dependent 26S proteasome regulatory subunit
LLNPEFISFLLKNKSCILIIEDAEKVITTREYQSESSVVSTILQLTDGLFSDYLNIKIICTFNTSIERVDKALLRKGRMIANYEFKPLSKEKTNKLLESRGFDAVDKEMALADIFNFDKRSFEGAANSKKIGFNKD